MRFVSVQDLGLVILMYSNSQNRIRIAQKQHRNPGLSNELTLYSYISLSGPLFTFPMEHIFNSIQCLPSLTWENDNSLGLSKIFFCLSSSFAFFQFDSLEGLQKKMKITWRKIFGRSARLFHRWSLIENLSFVGENFP